MQIINSYFSRLRMNLMIASYPHIECTFTITLIKLDWSASNASDLLIIFYCHDFRRNNIESIKIN
jgi:hypothetical protein